MTNYARIYLKYGKLLKIFLIKHWDGFQRAVHTVYEVSELNSTP